MTHVIPGEPRFDENGPLMKPRSSKPIQIWLAAVGASIALTVLIGGVTRLTNSGLSIVEWRPVMGALPPMTEVKWSEAFERYKEIPEYSIENPDMDLSGFKRIYYWEFVHRNAGRWTGLIFFAPFLYFLRRHRLSPRLIPRLWLILALGALQGGLGWLMVKSGLSERTDVSPERLAAHFSLALILYSLTIVTLLDLRGGRTGPPARGRLALGALFALQIIFGALVAGLRAGHSYNTFPTMNGEWIPSTLWSFDPWWINPIRNGATAQFAHRWLGVALMLGTVWFWRKARRLPWPTGRQWALRGLPAVALFQGTLGVATLVHSVPLVAAAAHQLIALAFLTLLLICFR